MTQLFEIIPDSDPHVMVHEYAEAQLKLHGLWQLGWRFELSKRKRQVGTCFFRQRLIVYSSYYLDRTSEHEIKDTILHEIAHALVGPGHGHDATWKRMAIRIGARPERCTSQAVTTAEYNYLIKCPNCPRKWYRHRMRRRNYDAKCPACLVKVEIYELNT